MARVNEIKVQEVFRIRPTNYRDSYSEMIKSLESYYSEKSHYGNKTVLKNQTDRHMWLISKILWHIGLFLQTNSKSRISKSLGHHIELPCLCYMYIEDQKSSNNMEIFE